MKENKEREKRRDRRGRGAVWRDRLMLRPFYFRPYRDVYQWKLNERWKLFSLA